MKNGFGRLSQKQQREYQALRRSLLDSKLDSPAQARQLLANIRKRALLFGAVILAAVALALLLFPASRALALLIGGLGLVWLLAITVKGYQLIGRYIREELGRED